jgi:hypothetical protein
VAGLALVTSAVLFCSARYRFHRACAVVAHFDPGRDIFTMAGMLRTSTKSWRYSLRFCLFPLIFHVARYLSVFITHTPPPPLVKKQSCVLAASRFVVPPFDTYIHTYLHTYIHAYIHTIFSHTIFLCHTQSFTYHFVTHNRFYFSILHHLLCLSFLPCPAATFVAHDWKKLTRGVIRSFNYYLLKTVS